VCPSSGIGIGIRSKRNGLKVLASKGREGWTAGYANMVVRPQSLQSKVWPWAMLALPCEQLRQHDALNAMILLDCRNSLYVYRLNSE